MFRIEAISRVVVRAGLGFRPIAVVVAVFLLGWIRVAGTAHAQSTAEQWHRWEKELRTTRDYHQVLVNGVLQKDNPYRKLTLRVTYSPVSCAVPTGPWCQAFSGYGYWDGGRVFKIRGSFPAGTWSYSVSCSGNSGGTSTAPLTCSDDPVLNQSGAITVNNTNPAEPDLFERGFVRRSTNSGLKYLTYGDGQAPFYWRADTAWAAANVPNSNNSTNSTRWANFLNDRKAKGFTAIMMGVAPDGADPNNARNVLWDDVSQSDAPCAANPAAWPQLCSRWRPEFWRKFDEMIRSTNEAGFLVVLIGVMDPQGNAPSPASPQYPASAAASIFARNLAARLAGDHVIFSPSFDDRLSTTRTLMDAVGTELGGAVPAAPRHLLTAHLAGASNICDYYDMHNTAKHPWHQLHIFQSGHAINTADCPGETPYQCAVRRARDIPDLLSPTPTNPPVCTDPAPNSTTVKPNANGEAAYDNTYTLAAAGTVDSPYGVRHTGYNSALNGAFGVTLGVLGTWNWGTTSPTNPDTDGSRHMGILGTQFNLNPWQMLQRRSLRIKNQAAGAERRMTMAVTLDNNFAMIYMPDNDEIRFDGTFLTGFDCTNTTTWTVTWVNPRTSSTLDQGTCQNISDPSGATRLLRRPLCSQASTNGPRGECDWVVKVRRSGFYGSSATPQSANLDVWSAPTEDGSGWRILGRLKAVGGQEAGEPFSISETTLGTRLKLPVMAQDAEGSFVVVWESEDDGSLHGLFLRRVDGQGRLLDREYPINVTKEYDQTHPAVALDPAGRGGVVTWTSYAQDGDSGGIFARLLNPAGVPFGKEVPVNQSTTGRQDFSKAAVNTQGRFLVAWTSDSKEGDLEGAFARWFDEKGNPLGPEFRVNTTTEGAQWLTNVEPEAQGSVLVTWTSYAPDGGELGLFGQRYGVDGSPTGGEFLVVPPPAVEPQ